MKVKIYEHRRHQSQQKTEGGDKKQETPKEP